MASPGVNDDGVSYLSVFYCSYLYYRLHKYVYMPMVCIKVSKDLGVFDIETG